MSGACYHMYVLNHMSDNILCMYISGADTEGGGELRGHAPPPETVGLLCYIICLKWANV